MARHLIQSATTGDARIVGDAALAFFPGYAVVDTYDDGIPPAVFYGAGESDLRYVNVTELSDPESAPSVALRAASERGGPYLLATFGGENVGPDELSLCVYSSVDGKNFLSSHTNPVVYASPGMRDPSIIEVDGRFYVAVTTASFTVGQYTDQVAIWTTTDPMSRTWTLHTTVDFSGPAQDVNPEVWAPKFFVDTNGSVFLYVSVDQTTLWCVEFTDRTVTSHGAPVAVTPSPTVGSQIDPYVIRVGSTYHMFFKKNGDLSVAHATATSPTGPFTVTQTGLAWNGLNALAAPTGAGFEGPVVVQVSDTRWRMYLDVTHVGGLYYAETSDPTLASGWTTWSPCLIDGVHVSGGGRLRHGTVIRLARPEIRAAARLNNSTPRANSLTLQRKERTAGDLLVTGSGGTWGLLDSALNMVFPNCRAGDWLQCGANVVWTADASNEGQMDFRTVVGGVLTANGFAANNAFNGIGQVALFAPGGTGILPASTTDWYQVDQSDINSDGSVVVALVGKGTGSGRTVYAGNTNGLAVWGRKHT